MKMEPTNCQDIPRAPTSSLPPLACLATHSCSTIHQAITNLRLLYFPPPPPPLPTKISLPKRTIRHTIHDDSIPDSGYASAEEDDDLSFLQESVTHDTTTDGSEEPEALELLRCDPFERSFAIKWITGFVSRSDLWIDASASDEEADARIQILDESISILSSFTRDENGEDAAEVVLTRSFSFPTDPLSAPPIKVELIDAPLSSEDHTSVGLQSWGSSILLAERMCASPNMYSMVPPPNLPSTRRLRVLELGAGTGILSIIAARLLLPSDPEIIATDYHPDVLSNLSKNVSSNFPNSSPIGVHALDWESPKYTAPLDAPFDVILAGDVIYHPEHAEWIKRCLEHLLLRPSDQGTGGGVFWLIIPLRTTGRHEGMHCTVDALFPAASSLTVANGWALAVLLKEEVGRHAGVGRADEGGYKLYKIGWARHEI